MENLESREKVVSIFSASKRTSAHATDESKIEHASEDFESVMAKNKAVQERMRQERLKANRTVLRSYRIKT